MRLQAVCVDRGKCASAKADNVSVDSLLNPMFLFVLICLGGFWGYASSVAANETPENPMLVFGKPVTPEQRKLGLTGSTWSLFTYFV